MWVGICQKSHGFCLKIKHIIQFCSRFSKIGLLPTVCAGLLHLVSPSARFSLFSFSLIR